MIKPATLWGASFLQQGLLSLKPSVQLKSAACWKHLFSVKKVELDHEEQENGVATSSKTVRGFDGSSRWTMDSPTTLEKPKINFLPLPLSHLKNGDQTPLIFLNSPFKNYRIKYIFWTHYINFGILLLSCCPVDLYRGPESCSNGGIKTGNDRGNSPRTICFDI